MLLASAPRFAVVVTVSVYDGRDAIVGSTSRVIGSAYTLGWARHLLAAEIDARGDYYEDDAHIGVKELHNGRWSAVHPSWDGTRYAPAADALEDCLPF